MRAKRTRIENASFVIDSIKALGLQPHRDSRLMQMYRVLVENPKIRAGERNFEIALESERDLQVLAFIFDCAESQPNDTEFRRLIKIALKDSVLPQENTNGSKGRDAQFELFVAAICQSARLSPINREEPDVTCVIHGRKYCIAAKRVKSVARLENRLKEAANQIYRTSWPGIIALETSMALNRENERIIVPISNEEFGRLYKQAFDHFVDDFHDRIQNWVYGKWVRGIVLHDQQVRFESDGDWSLAGMSYWISTLGKCQDCEREFLQFKYAYIKGLPNLH